MEIDTGASLSILSSATYRDKFNDNDKPLTASHIMLRTYDKQPLKNLGTFNVEVHHNAQKVELPLVVVEGNGPDLLGRNWLKHLQID